MIRRSRERQGAEKGIAAYTHPGPRSSQQPDTAPGNYYVSAVDPDTRDLYLMLGPFPNDHASALAAVDEVRALCMKHGGVKAHFMSYGTVRVADGVTKPGSANELLRHLLPAARAGTA